VNGQRRYFNKTLHGSKKDAEKYLREMLCRRDLGELIEPTAELADSFFNKWMETVVKPRVRARSFHRYEETLRLYITPELGQKRLADIRSIDLQHLYIKLRDRNLSPTMIRHVHGLISNAFK
jgi:integrase